MRKTYTHEDFIQLATRAHGNEFEYGSLKYGGWTKPVDLICRTHGSFSTTPRSHVKALSGGCKGCLERVLSTTRRISGDEFASRARLLHAGKYDYSQSRMNGWRKKTIVVCPLHGPFKVTPEKHLTGQGCRRCMNDKLRRQRRLPFWEFVDRAVAAHGAYQFDYEIEGLLNLHSKIRIHCPAHGTFEQTAASHLRGHGCPACIQSQGERRVRHALTSLGVEFVEQARFENCRRKRPLPFDFFVPRHRLLIEFDGRQHYEKSDLWGGDEKLLETQENDRLKSRFAQQHGYRLLRIPHWELNAVESRVLDHLAETEPIAA